MSTSTLVRPRGHAAREGYDLRLRTRVLIHRSAIDQALADGLDPTESRELTLRARQIVSRRSRELLAGGVERAITSATRPLTRVSAAAPLCRDQILEARPLLLTLAAELRAPGAVRAQGVALTRQLLIHGSSALYEPSEPGGLSQVVEDARRGLLPSDGGGL